ncbi:hypothetical protein C0Q70_10505 [Pomacea canaliculata]|uniref:CCHC-type domain-containing protein n=1 Tax=Pomacea canaliculata TaxID=400727 RepID=A0A2T7P3E0_POMCA|nr:hypothetical protein C0Q70_10505 [Pomacea canaliculata]
MRKSDVRLQNLSIYLRERDSSTVDALAEYAEHYRTVHSNKCLARRTETSRFANVTCDSQPSSTPSQRNRCPTTSRKRQGYMKASSYRESGKDKLSPRFFSTHRLRDDPNHQAPQTSWRQCYNCKQYGHIARNCLYQRAQYLGPNRVILRRKNQKEATSSGDRLRWTSQRQCYTCEGFGHIAKKCPNHKHEDPTSGNEKRDSEDTKNEMLEGREVCHGPVRASCVCFF